MNAREAFEHALHRPDHLLHFAHDLLLDFYILQLLAALESLILLDDLVSRLGDFPLPRRFKQFALFPRGFRGRRGRDRRGPARDRFLESAGRFDRFPARFGMSRPLTTPAR